VVGTDQVMSLSAGQEEADRIAERIGQCMDFRALSLRLESLLGFRNGRVM
jgi:hypothetical protein